MFNQFQNKIVFEPFILDAHPCPKCSCAKVLISPTSNTHAASSRCANANCGKFFRWLGKSELKSCAAQGQRLDSASTISATTNKEIEGDNHVNQLQS